MGLKVSFEAKKLLKSIIVVFLIHISMNFFKFPFERGLSIFSQMYSWIFCLFIYIGKMKMRKTSRKAITKWKLWSFYSHTCCEWMGQWNTVMETVPGGHGWLFDPLKSVFFSATEIIPVALFVYERLFYKFGGKNVALRKANDKAKISLHSPTCYLQKRHQNELQFGWAILNPKVLIHIFEDISAIAIYGTAQHRVL